MEDQLALSVGIFAPVGSHIGGTIIQNNITFLIFELLSQLLITGGSGDVSLEAAGTRNTLDWVQIDTNDGRIERHALTCDLHPASRSSTEIDESVRAAEEAVLAVELYEFVGCSGAVALLLGEMVISVKSLLGLGLLTHVVDIINCLIYGLPQTSHIIMDARQKLLNLQQQKRKLKQRLGEIGNLQSKSYVQDPQLERLLLKKKELEEERLKKAEYEKLEKQYNERKKQIEREKELQRIQNQKRVLQLEAAMKRVVFEGIKQKVKGMNSEQLMRRGFLHNEDEPEIREGQKQNGNFKQVFQGYLLDQGPEKAKQKYDVKQLNQKRKVIFQQKQEIVMRQILLKELAASDNPDEIEVMSLTREQLERELRKRQIDYEEYMHPIKKEEILENLPLITEAAENRIDDKKRQFQENKEEALNQERYKKALRQDIKSMPYKDVEVVRRLLYDFFDEICDDYEKRHVPLSQEDQSMRVRNLEQQYIQISNQRLVQQLSQQLVRQMLQDMRRQMVKESAEQVFKLHEYAHSKTEDCFKPLFNDEVLQRIKELDKYKFPLVFVSEEQNQVGRVKEDKYMKKLQNDYGIYETEENTTNLVNDILLLDAEQKFMEKVNSLISNKLEYKTEDTIFYYDRELIAINRQHIKSVFTPKVYHIVAAHLEPIVRVAKMNRNWLIQTQKQILLVTPWGREEFGSQLGARISNPCGEITFSLLYPVTTLLGNPCSSMLGFQKGQVLKFNFNRNRVTGRQLNITHYLPVIENAKSGDDPAFPLDNRNYLPVEIEKPKPNDEIHQYREFFQHHSEPVVFVGFYRIDKLVTVDRSLKCALWEYSKARGVGAYEPVFKFQLRSSYQIFTEDENPRYKDIYPTSNSNSSDTPESMYQKYMMTENFLKLQLYNNPKKEIAYFKAPQWDSTTDEKPIWKITYKDSKGQVNKILQSFYNVQDGKITAQQALISNDALYVVCEREHVIRNDLKTIKVYSWNINQKRLGKVGLQIDMFKDQKVSNFMVLNNHFKGLDMELALIVNSGRLLLFSLVSGQLLKNINEEVRTEGKQADIYFKSIVRAVDKGIIYGISNGDVMELSWEDSNSINDRNRLNKAIDAAKRKFFR